MLYTEIGYIEIELNARYQEYLHVRNLAYHCDNYAHYTLRGEEYKEDVKIIQIDFTYGMRHEEREEIKVYEMQNDRGKKYVDNFLLYEFNMDRIMQFWYSKEEKKIEEYKYLIMLDLGLEELNESPEFHIYMTEEEDRRKCFNTEISLAKKEGIEEGSKQNAMDVAKKLLNKLSLKEIQEITNLSLEEIENLK